MNVFIEEIAPGMWRVFVVADFSEFDIAVGSKEQCLAELKRYGITPTVTTHAISPFGLAAAA